MPWPLIAAAAATVGNALLQGSANKENIENQWKLYQAQNRRQDELNANSALIQRQALSKAGLNINSEYGGYPNLVGATPTKSDVTAPQLDSQGFLGALQLAQQKPLVDAQVAKTKEDTRKQKIENDREQSYDDSLNAWLEDYFEKKTKELGVDDSLVYGRHSGFYNKGTYQAQIDQRKILSDFKQFDAQDAKNLLDSVIYDEQLKDSKVIQAFKELPWYQVRKIDEEISNLIKDRSVMDSVIALNNSSAALNDSNKSWVDFQKKVAEQTNIANIVSRIIDSGDVTIEDVTKVLLIGLLKAVKAM